MANVPVSISTAFGSGALLNSVITDHLREVIKRTPTEQSYVKSAFWNMVYDKASRVPAAHRWQWPVKAIGTSRAEPYLGAQVSSTAGADDITMASEQVAFYRCPLQLLHTDIKIAGGGQALFDLSEAKLASSKEELATKLGTDTWSSTSVTTPAYGLQGIRLAFPADPTASVAYNSLNGAASTQEYWRNSTNTSIGSFATNGVDSLDSLSAKIHSAGGEWAYGFTDITTHNYIKKAARTHMSVNANITGSESKRVASFGYSAVEFENKGIFAESNTYLAAGTGIIYFVPDQNKFELRIVEGQDFHVTEFAPLTPGGQSGMVAWVEFAGQFCLHERRSGGQNSGYTA